MANIIVLFEVTIREGKMKEYLQAAASLMDELDMAEGLIGAERFSSLATDGKLLSKSEWKDEASIAKWRNVAKHRMSQEYGRLDIFADYKITVVTPIRTYTIDARDGAPADSNQYFKL